MISPQNAACSVIVLSLFWREGESECNEEAVGAESLWKCASGKDYCWADVPLILA